MDGPSVLEMSLRLLGKWRIGGAARGNAAYHQKVIEARGMNHRKGILDQAILREPKAQDISFAGSHGFATETNWPTESKNVSYKH